MKNKFDKNLQELLRSHSEQPSLDCWDKISSRLDAMQAINAGSAAGNASAFSQFVGSVVGKIAITAVVATSIATATYFILSDKDEVLITEQTQEISAMEQGIALLPAESTKVEVAENKTETMFSSDKIVRENDFSSVETNTKETEEPVNAFLPIPNTEVNPSDLPKEKETSPQPQETVQQQHSQPVIEEVVAENLIEIPENREELEAPEAPKLPKIIIPNIFTPNGDGDNDFFFITNLDQLKNTQLEIYTKEGKRVYNKRFYDNSWDGRGLPDGTYYYIFTFIYEGNQFTRNSFVTIKRN